MWARAKRLREWLQTSLAVIPAAAAVAAYGLARLLTFIDARLAQDAEAWWLFGGTADSAGLILSTIASSLMQFIAVAFSITILVLQLASGQFSPRVLRTFLEDRNTKWTMAVFIGAFVYATSLLLEVRTDTLTQSEFVPALAIFTGFLLVLVSVFMFIRYIQNMGHAIRAVTIIHRVAAETRTALVHLYPESALRGHEDPSLRAPSSPPDRVITNEKSPGVVSEVDEDNLVKLACHHDIVLGLVPQVGDFLPRGAPMFKLWGHADVTVDQLRDHVVVSLERTPHQDAAFGFRQLVDIAERALSPGVNDPTTAVQALDQLHDLLRDLANRNIPSPLRVDADHRLRLILPRPDWDSYVHLAVDEIRQYGKASIQVMRRLRGMLEDLLTCASADRCPILRQQLLMVQEMVDAQWKGFDRAYASLGNG